MSAENCGKLLLLQAELDGELDAAAAAALAEHRASCPVCRRNESAILAARQALRRATYHRADPEFLRSLAGRIGGERGATGRPSLRRRVSPPWRRLATFGAGAALAAAIILAVVPLGRQDTITALVDDHVRALQPGHLLDVVSTNQHTVKPWFDGKLDFAPPVRNLAAEGFPLLGGRLDYLHGRSVAVLVYSRGKHLVELFVWPASGGTKEPASAAHKGYNVIHWTANGMSFSAVSDLEAAGLQEFVRDWQQAS
ncbi:MAG TPA: anti-sigma factor [Steroidobacteraceae bacterium]|nr:anti-sigma factor [Steroidobacteraceae bacterium]